MNANKNASLSDFEIAIDAWMTQNDSFVTEAGDIEKWDGSSKDKLLQNKEETIKYLESLKK